MIRCMVKLIATIQNGTIHAKTVDGKYVVKFDDGKYLRVKAKDVFLCGEDLKDIFDNG